MTPGPCSWFSLIPTEPVPLGWRWRLWFLGFRIKWALR